MATPVVLTAVQDLALGLLEKLPELIGRIGREKQTKQTATLLQTDLHYLLNIVDRMQERQGRMLEQQQIVALQAISIALGQAREQIVSLVSTPRELIVDSTSPAYVHMQQSLTAARDHVITSIQKLPLASPTESTAALAVVARWQMTDAPYYRGYRDSAQYEDWTILTYLFEQYVHYIAVSGADPASASVRYSSAMLDEYPHKDDDWKRLLTHAIQHFDEFVALPGTGIYDLVVRLGRHGIHTPESRSASDAN